MSSLPAATSHTHQHILAILNTILAGRSFANPIRVLDLGCGNGSLVAYLLQSLPLLRPDLQFWISGLDVKDSNVQEAGYIENTRADLQQRWPQFNWRDRISYVSAADPWPFDADSIDFVVSNQVLEHVRDHGFVVAQLKRCLRPGGASINLFPLREVLWEGHAQMPLVHRISDQERRRKWMLRLARLGFRQHYYRDKDRYHWRSLEEFARVFSSVLETDTNYLSAREYRRLAGSAGLEISFAYTKDYFLSKLLSLGGVRILRYRSYAAFDAAGFYLGRYLSSSTMVLKRPT
jgi:SAM-dependent methyltransferase